MDHHARLVIRLTVNSDAHAERMSVHARVWMPYRRNWKQMCSLESEFFIDTHGNRLGDFAGRGQTTLTAGLTAYVSGGSSASWDGQSNSQWRRGDWLASLGLHPWAGAGN